MRTTPTPLGNVVLALSRHGIRQVDIAARYPCSPGFVNKVIRGRFPPPARFREVAAELTGLPEGELFPEPHRSSGRRETAEARAAEITARYLAGESEHQLMTSLGMSKVQIRHALTVTGTPRRGRAEASRLTAAARSRRQRDEFAALGRAAKLDRLPWAAPATAIVVNISPGSRLADQAWWWRSKVRRASRVVRCHGPKKRQGCGRVIARGQPYVARTLYLRTGGAARALCADCAVRTHIGIYAKVA